MENQTMNQKDYCKHCEHYDNKMDVCTKFHFNLGSNPNYFMKKCAGEYFESDKNDKPDPSRKDTTSERIERPEVKKETDQKDIHGNPDKSNVCQNCGRKTHRGRNYKVFYGIATGSRKSGGYGAPNTTITTNYQIKGNKEVFLCHWCVAEKIIKEQKQNTLWVTFFLIVLVLLFFTDIIRLHGAIRVIGIILPLIIIWLMFSHDKRLQKRFNEKVDDVINLWDQKEVNEKGDEIAKKAIRPLLEKEGHDFVWTRKEYGELQS